MREKRPGTWTTCWGTLLRLGWVCTAIGWGVGNAASPALKSVLPRLAQRGTEVEVTFRGEHLSDAEEILFYDPGISLLAWNRTTNTTLVKARLKVASDARLGQHVLRVRTASGLSEARTFSVGQYPVVEEKEPNNDFAAPQKIDFNTTVRGVAGSEDIDYFAVDAKKGQRITAEVEAMRLGGAMVDCHVALFDANRFELAACDDSVLSLQDPVISILAPADGRYVIAVRESSFAGNNNSHYCLHVGGAPRPMVAFPAGGKAGDEVSIRFLGDPKGDLIRNVRLPSEAVGDWDYSLVDDGQSVPSANRLRVTAFPNVLESEPNDSAAAVSAPTPSLPVAFNGVISRPGDVDYFRLRGKAGERFDIHCVARGIRSPLDPVLAIRKTDGTQIMENDDAGGPDSVLNWTVPSDGEFLVSVRDHLRGGSPLHVYRVEFRPVLPEVVLSIPEFVRNSQERNSVTVPLGNRSATLIRVTRSQVAGEVTLSAPGLPPGISMACDPVAAGVNEVPVVFEASADAVPSVRLVSLSARVGTNAAVKGRFLQNLELIHGEPNNTVYYQTSVDRMGVAVGTEAPFQIEVAEPKAPLVRSGSMDLKVHVERRPGFKGVVKLKMLWNPPGLGSQNEVSVPEGQSNAVYSINANAEAATRTWRTAVLASADAGNGVVWTSSRLIPITVAEPHVSMKIPMVAGEQGKNVTLIGRLQQLRPFEGEARVRLYGLPPKVVATQDEMRITSSQQEVLFPLTIAADAPVGQHKGLFCQVIVLTNGEPMVHSVGGGGVLRIDAPRSAKSGDAPVASSPAKTNAVHPSAAMPAASSKPLSRLEKLRMESRERLSPDSK